MKDLVVPENNFVLILGDEIFIQTIGGFLQFFKACFGISFTEYTPKSGENALLLLSNKTPEQCLLIICQQKIKITDGIEFFMKVRKNTPFFKTPFILMSDNFDPIEIDIMKKLKIDFLTFSVTDEQFTRKIAFLLKDKKIHFRLGGDIIILTSHNKASLLIKGFLDMSGLGDKLHCRIIVFHSVYEAINFLNQSNPEQIILIICDSQFTGYNIFDFISEMKGTREFEHIPIILLSNDIEPEQIEFLSCIKTNWSPWTANAFKANLEDILGINL